MSDSSGGGDARPPAPTPEDAPVPDETPDAGSSALDVAEEPADDSSTGAADDVTRPIEAEPGPAQAPEPADLQPEPASEPEADPDATVRDESVPDPTLLDVPPSSEPRQPDVEPEPEPEPQPEPEPEPGRSVRRS